MSDKEEQQFTIQPHPATTNDPSTDPALQGDSAKQAAQTSSESKPGVFVPQNAEGLEKPKSSEELKAASAELNK